MKSFFENQARKFNGCECFVQCGTSKSCRSDVIIIFEHTSHQAAHWRPLASLWFLNLYAIFSMIFACNTIRYLTTLPRVNTISFLAKFFWHFLQCFIWDRPELRFYDLASIVSVPITICKPVRLRFVLLHSLQHPHQEIQWQENVVLKCYLWLCNTLTIYGCLLRMISKFHFKYWPNLSELFDFYSYETIRKPEIFW